MIAVARAGQSIPATAGGGTYGALFGPLVDDAGDVLFAGGLRENPGTYTGVDEGLFLYSKGTVTAVARPGQSMPGGGTFVTLGDYVSDYGIANNGAVVFAGLLANGQQGLYLWSAGTLPLVARSGTVIPGGGVIQQIMDPTAQGTFGAKINDLGQVFFTAKLADGTPGAVTGAQTDVLIVATPTYTILTGTLDPACDTGVSKYDGITANNTPTFLGTANPGAVVRLGYHGPFGVITPLGQTMADAKGRWTLTLGPLADNCYAFRVDATPPVAGVADSSLELGTLTIDTQGPQITAMAIDLAHGLVWLSVRDNGGGMTPTSIVNTSDFLVTRPQAVRRADRTTNHVTAVALATSPSDPGPQAPRLVAIQLDRGRRITNGLVRIQIRAAGLMDQAGNALRGTFQGWFPTGLYRRAADFLVDFTVNGRRVSRPRTVRLPSR